MPTKDESPIVLISSFSSINDDRYLFEITNNYTCVVNKYSYLKGCLGSLLQNSSHENEEINNIIFNKPYVVLNPKCQMIFERKFELISSMNDKKSENTHLSRSSIHYTSKRSFISSSTKNKYNEHALKSKTNFEILSNIYLGSKALH